MEQYGLGNVFKKKRNDVMRNIRMFYEKSISSLRTDPANYLSGLQIEEAKKIRDYLKKKFAKKPSEELKHIINTYEVYLLSDTIPKQFKKKFFSWLVGRGDETTIKNTGFPLVPDWGIRHIPEIKEIISELVDIIINTKHALQRLSLTGPLNFEESYYYFRFLVDVEWMKTANQYFFVNFLDFTEVDNIGEVADVLVVEAPNAAIINDEPIIDNNPPQADPEANEDLWEFDPLGETEIEFNQESQYDFPREGPSLFTEPILKPEDLAKPEIKREELIKLLPNIETVIEEGLNLNIVPEKKQNKVYNIYKKSLKRRHRNYYGLRKNYKKNIDIDHFNPKKRQ